MGTVLVVGPQAPRKRSHAPVGLTRYLKVDGAPARGVNFHVAQVAGHALFVVRRAVVLAERVEDAARRGEALGEVAKGVHRDGVAARGQALDGAVDARRRILLRLPPSKHTRI